MTREQIKAGVLGRLRGNDKLTSVTPVLEALDAAINKLLPATIGTTIQGRFVPRMQFDQAYVLEVEREVRKGAQDMSSTRSWREMKSHTPSPYEPVRMHPIMRIVLMIESVDLPKGVTIGTGDGQSVWHSMDAAGKICADPLYTLLNTLGVKDPLLHYLWVQFPADSTQEQLDELLKRRAGELVEVRNKAEAAR